MDADWLVLGVGNTLLQDEGAGVHVIRHLAQEAQGRGLEGAELVDGGTLSFTLAPRLQNISGLIVVDAAQLCAAAGTVQVMEGAAMDAFLLHARRLSVHEVCLGDLLAMAHAAGELPACRALVGIQPACVEWGDEPTVHVASAVRIAARRVQEILARWRSEMSLRPAGVTG
jgi:hydrogenase maturation protease